MVASTARAAPLLKSEGVGPRGEPLRVPGGAHRRFMRCAACLLVSYRPLAARRAPFLTFEAPGGPGAQNLYFLTYD